MPDSLYARLAAANLKKHRQLYVPYLLAGAGTVMMFCILLTLTNDPALLALQGGGPVRMVLSLGCVVIAVFSTLLLFYTNSALAKQRQKEFGLYNVLGMEKRHIGRVLAWETLYTALIALIGGMACGVVFSKLVQLLLLRILGGDLSFGVRVDPAALGGTALLFAGIYLLVYLRARRIVRISHPVELLRGSDEGEREPRSRWLLATLGILCVGGGYALSLLCTSAAFAILMFFVAVILVIAGTYMLFTAFSIVFLKALRKNKRYYYRTSHFATVSGMLYRMKRNAAGLASICILSTMVLVTASTTISLYLGMNGILDALYPFDVRVNYNDGQPRSQTELETVLAGAQDIAEAHGLTITRSAVYPYYAQSVLRDADALTGSSGGGKETVLMWLTTAAGYESLTGRAVSLAPDEALVYFSRDAAPADGVLTLFGLPFRVTELDAFPVGDGFRNLDAGVCYAVVDSEQTLLRVRDALLAEVGIASSESLCDEIQFDLSGTDAEKISCADELDALTRTTARQSDGSVSTVSNFHSRQVDMQTDYLPFYGSFFFLGMFLGLLFIMATVLIIYYKQISEGYDDRNKFAIMQKVGMTKKEVRATIHSQVLIVFFLPLGTAAVHTAFAFPMIRWILAAFGMVDIPLFLACTGGSILVFAVLYTAVYLATARVYARIVGGLDRQRSAA